MRKPEDRDERRLCGCIPGEMACSEAAHNIRELRVALQKAILEETWAPFDEAYARFRTWMDAHLRKWASPLRTAASEHRA